MGFVEGVKARLWPEKPAEPQPETTTTVSTYEAGEVDEKTLAQVAEGVSDQAGVSTIEASQAIWGKRGKPLIMAGQVVDQPILNKRKLII